MSEKFDSLSGALSYGLVIQSVVRFGAGDGHAVVTDSAVIPKDRFAESDFHYTHPVLYFEVKKRRSFDGSPFCLAGVAGFGPTNEGVKVPCLTAWLYPYVEM